MSSDKKKKNPGRAWEERNPEQYLWYKAKVRAEKTGQQFTIRVCDVIIPKYCPYLEIPLNTEKGRGYNNPDCPQLDRYDSALGYTEHNIQVISGLANTMKNYASAEQLDTFAKNQILKYASARVRKEMYDELKKEFGE